MLKAWKKPFLPLLTKMGKSKEARHFTEEPVLIGGCGRSGTTLLLSVLSAHPRVFAIPKELGLFNVVARDEYGNPYPTRIDRLYFNLLKHRIPKSARRWCEKSPSNVNNIAAIDSIFEGNFKLIHIIRDGRDVVLSVHPTDPNRYWVEPSRWVKDVKNGLQFREHPNVHTIFYEDLIRDYQSTARGICDFLNLPFGEEMKNWHQHAAVRQNRAYFNPVEDLKANSIGKWKNDKNRDRVREFLEYPAAAELLQELGYS